MTRITTYTDQIDAEEEARAWLEVMVPTNRHRVFWQLETFSFSPHDGRR